MSIRNSVAVAFVGLLAAMPAMAQADSPPPPSNSPPPTEQVTQKGRLTPEEQAMMFMDARDKLSSMPADQRKAYRKQLRQQWATLTPKQKAAKQAQFDSEWNALPENKRDKIETHIQQKASSHHGGANDDGPDDGPQ